MGTTAHEVFFTYFFRQKKRNIFDMASSSAKVTIHDDRDAEEETGSVISLGSIPLETTRPATSISTVDTQNRQVRLIKQSHNVSTKKPTLGATETAAATTTVKRAKMLLAHNVPWRFESTLHWRPVL